MNNLCNTGESVELCLERVNRLHKKYEKKYVELLNLINKNITSKYIICLLWFNKNKTEINQFGPDSNNLDIKNNIVKTYNIFKQKYYNPKVVLFLNYDKIIDSDMEFFQTRGVETEDINLFRTINETNHLKRLFDMSKNNDINAPKIYVYVDMLKIIIQYEKMVYDNYEYVFFFDLDIQDKDKINQNDVICGIGQSNYVDEYFPENLFNEHNLELLDVFGYLYAGIIDTKKLQDRELHDLKNSNELKKKLDGGEIVKVFLQDSTKTGEIIKYYYATDLENEITDEKIKEYMDNNFLKRKIREGKISVVDGEYYSKKTSAFGENSVLISKNDPLVIETIKKYFIDYVFNDQNDNISKYSNNRIWRSYKFFYMHLNYLKGFILLSYKLSKEEYDELKKIELTEISFDDFTSGKNGDYWCDIKPFTVKINRADRTNKTNRNYIITMISQTCVNYFVQTYGYDCVWFDYYFTPLGKSMYNKYKNFLGNFDDFMVEPRFMTEMVNFIEFSNVSNVPLIPFSCFPIGKQKNSTQDGNESGKVNGCKYNSHRNIFDETSVIFAYPSTKN